MVEEGADAGPAVPDEVAEAIASAGRDDAAGTEGPADPRYLREDADRLPDDLLADIARRRTGATEAAFFDLDKTIIARSSTLALGRTFMRDGLIGPSTMVRGMYAQLVYQLVGADHDRMEQSRNAMLELTRGWEAERIRELVRETMEDVIAPLVFQEALDLFAEHRRRGRDLWIVSSSGEEVVTPFGGYLGIDDVIATVSGIDDEGRYDGTLAFYAYAGNKATAVRQVAEVRGYDLDRCYAYSDSVTDLQFLSAVGHPVAVNPDRELRAAATAMQWEARDFVSPVSLRERLPSLRRPTTNELLLAAGAAAVAGLTGWAVATTRDRQTD